MFSSVICPDKHPLPGYRCRRVPGSEGVMQDFWELCSPPAPGEAQFVTGDESDHDGPGYLGPSCGEKGTRSGKRDTQHPKARSGGPGPGGLWLPGQTAEPPQRRCPLCKCLKFCPFCPQKSARFTSQGGTSAVWTWGRTLCFEAGQPIPSYADPAAFIAVLHTGERYFAGAGAATSSSHVPPSTLEGTHGSCV